MIVLASVFRDSTSYLPRYFEQIEKLRANAPEAVYLVTVEGDSNDDTLTQLRRGPTDEVLKVEHGGRYYEGVVHPLRWRQLSVACNAALCAANRAAQTTDRFVYVESDLIWEPSTILSLLNRLDGDTHAIAPMSMQGGRFYDIWGHVKDGRRFNSHRPFYEGWNPVSTTLVEIDSAGSCFVTDFEALKIIEFSAIDCIRGIGRSLRANGMKLYLDPSQKVEHP